MPSEKPEKTLSVSMVEPASEAPVEFDHGDSSVVTLQHVGPSAAGARPNYFVQLEVVDDSLDAIGQPLREPPDCGDCHRGVLDMKLE